jgi:hypothetical protein
MADTIKELLALLLLSGISALASGRPGAIAVGRALARPSSPPALRQELLLVELPGAGKKCWIGEEHYFTYRFVQPPKIGTAILRVQLFDKTGQRVTDIQVTGNSGMPSMRGAHDSGEVPFELNKKGDYLLPVHIVMAGEWEVQLRFLKENEVIFLGSFRFGV